MDLLTYLLEIYSEMKLNQAHHWANKSNQKSVKVSSSPLNLWSNLFKKKFNETITEEDIYSTVSQEVRKTWMFGKKLWPNGLILKLSFISTVNKKNSLRDFYTEAKLAEDLMITNKQSKKDFTSSMTTQNQSLTITLNSVKFAELKLIDQSMQSPNKLKST